MVRCRHPRRRATAVSTEIHGWGLSVGRSEDFQLSAVKGPKAALIAFNPYCQSTHTGHRILKNSYWRDLTLGSGRSTNKLRQ